MEQRSDLIVKVKRPQGEDGCRVLTIRVCNETVEKIEQIADKTGHSGNALIGLFLAHAADICIIQRDPQ